MQIKKESGFSTIELLTTILLIGITYKLTNLATTSIKQTINTEKLKLNKLKLDLDTQITYSNLTDKKIKIIPKGNHLEVFGNPFISKITLTSPIKINVNDQRLMFYGKQVCSPASISYLNQETNCTLVLSLRCRARIIC